MQYARDVLDQTGTSTGERLARRLKHDEHKALNERARKDPFDHADHTLTAPLDIPRIKESDDIGAEVGESITVDTGTEETATSTTFNEVGLDNGLSDTDPIREVDDEKPEPDPDLGNPAVARQPRQSKILSLVDRFENGRRYPGYGGYWAPNDEKQNNVLDIGHHLYDLMLGGRLFLAPIGDNPKTVLDIGTGTGIWALEFAVQYPAAQVIGFDLSPVQPGRAMPNVCFEIKDACDPDWGYKKDSFDFIHVRAMSGCVADWPAYYQQVLTHLAPGGWYQQIEMSVAPTSDDGSVSEDSILGRWGKITLGAGDAMGKGFRIHQQIKGYLDAAGFEDVVELSYELPIGSWSEDPHLRDIGRWNQVHWMEGIEGWSLDLLTRILGWSHPMVRIYLGQMRLALTNRKIHAYHIVNAVYGQKPREGEIKR